MTPHARLDNIETRAHSAFRRNGIGHLMAGLSLALMGLFFFDHRLACAVFWAIGIWYWIGETLRRHLTYPRLGYAKIPADKRAAVLMGAAILAVLVVAALIEFSSLALWGMVYWAMVLTAVAGVLAWTRRSVLHAGLALLFAATGFIARSLVAPAVGDGRACAYQFRGLAAILITIGLIQLALLRRRHPALAEEGLDDNA